MISKAPRGTKDVIPAESWKWQYIENEIRKVCGAYCYKEVRVPVFEHTEVFERGVGDTTDVVQKGNVRLTIKGRKKHNPCAPRELPALFGVFLKITCLPIRSRQKCITCCRATATKNPRQAE